MQFAYLFSDVFVHVCLSRPHNCTRSFHINTRCTYSRSKPGETLMFIKSKRSAPDSPPHHAAPAPLRLCNGVKCVIQLRNVRAADCRPPRASLNQSRRRRHQSKEYSNCRAGTAWPRIQRQYAPQLVHQSEIIVLLRSAAVQVAKQIYDIITQTKDKRALYLGHTCTLSKGSLGGLQYKKRKSSSVSMVTEQSRPTYSISLVSQRNLILQDIV